MFFTSVHLKTKYTGALSSESRPALLLPCVGIFVLLAFTTVTVFVQSAWPLQTFEIGVYALAAVCLLAGMGGARDLSGYGWSSWLVCLIPLWGVGQLITHSTASSYDTRLVTLRWGALACVFLLGQFFGSSAQSRRLFLDMFLAFATAMAVLCVCELYSSHGAVLWIFPSGYSDVYGTFQYHANYAQFMELALPTAIWRAVRERRAAWWHAFSGAVIYASVIGAASRSGVVLCTVELLAMLAIALVKSKRGEKGFSVRATFAIIIAVPILATLLTLVVGWQTALNRLAEQDQFAGRREFLASALELTKRRPLAGYGLGTFPAVYQKYAVRDFPVYANHAHNDWAEFAAEGGLPFLFLVLVPFAIRIPAAVRHPWGLGIVAVLAHACVDYPFPRPAVSGWLFVLLGLLASAGNSSAEAPLSLRPAVERQQARTETK
jgi:O-antigen ligase